MFLGLVWGDCTSTHAGENVGHRHRLLPIESPKGSTSTPEGYAPPWVQSVTMAEIERQRSLGWPDWHPEDFCHRCGQRNMYCWHVDSEVWNSLDQQMLPGSHIICPACLDDIWRATHGPKRMWKIVPWTAADDDSMEPPASIDRLKAAEKYDTEQYILSCDAVDGDYLRFSWNDFGDDRFLWIESVVLSGRVTFSRRLRRAIRILFGRDTPNAEVVLNDKNVKGLSSFLQERVD